MSVSIETNLRRLIAAAENLHEAAALASARPCPTCGRACEACGEIPIADVDDDDSDVGPSEDMFEDLEESIAAAQQALDDAELDLYRPTPVRRREVEALAVECDRLLFRGEVRP